MMIGNPNLLLFFIVRWAKPLRSRKKKEILHRLSLFYFLQKKLILTGEIYPYANQRRREEGRVLIT